MSKVVKLDAEAQFALPPSLMGRVDISRILREVEKVDYELETQAIRTPQQPLSIPTMSRALTESAAINNIDISNIQQRKKLVDALRDAKDKAPVLQITFAVDPAPEIMSQLVAWIRQNLHPRALVTIGLQPNIVGGCVIRTPDHIYDFSMRKQFHDKRSILIDAVKAVAGQK